MPDLPAVDLDQYSNLEENRKTPNWSLCQGDEEVDKRIKQKIYI